MEDSDALRRVCLALSAVEVQFLITVLESCTEILTALLAVQKSFPGLAPSPFDEDAVVNIAALARKIADQSGG